MPSSTLDLEYHAYKKPFFDDLDGLSAIQKVRSTDLKDRHVEYRKFRETFKDKIQDFESTLNQNIGNFMYLADLWATSKDDTLKRHAKEMAMEYTFSEPKYFAFQERHVRGELKMGFCCQTALYTNKKIDE
jgi:hypothetical protein